MEVTITPTLMALPTTTMGKVQAPTPLPVATLAKNKWNNAILFICAFLYV